MAGSSDFDAGRLRRLSRAFYARPVLTVARECVGKLLVHQSPLGLLVGRIVEAEAYRGPEDRAAHSWGGRQTARTLAMYGTAGHAYMFLIYGLHWNFNVVTGRVGEPHAVLIRAIEPLVGAATMAQSRGMPADRRDLTNGPGKLCQALGLDRRHYGLDLCRSELFLADAAKVPVARSRRIGIDYAGSWAEKPWRFYDPTSAYISRLPARRAGT
ncbi:MAG TPA: DNA-3-methyladenine glycosylase [Polyangiaceae bacterium]